MVEYRVEPTREKWLVTRDGVPGLRLHFARGRL